MQRLRKLREDARQRFESLPWPSRTEEEWRRTDPSAFPLDQVELTPEAGAIQAGWETPSLTQPGVVLTDLETAVREFPGLVEEHLFQTGEPGGLKKFFSQHQAFWRSGLFCLVPRGVKLELPLKAWVEACQGSTAVFPHVLVVLEEGAEATLMDERRGGNGLLFSNEMVEIILKPDAVLRYVRLQRWGPSVSEVLMQRAILERNAQLLNITVGFGGRLTKGRVETVLRGSGARSELLGILFGSDSQHYDFHTLQDHEAPETFSDLLYKSALKDKAKVIYTGLIRISRQAQKSDAYQANRNLLLSEGAKADSIPMLEIEADDVRCTHGVAVGPVDEEQLFYLMSRGLPRPEAEQLIVEGFFDPVFRRIPVEALREELAQEVSNRLGAEEPVHEPVG